MKTSSTDLGPLCHYLLVGYLRGYDPCPEFRQNYIKKNRLLEKQINPLIDLARNPENVDKIESVDTSQEVMDCISKSSIFMAEWYLCQNEDIRDTDVDALEHFVNFGCGEDENPTPIFDPFWYAAEYPHVKNNV